MLGPAKILVVDDDPDMRDTVRAILEREAYSVTDVATGSEMLAVLQRQEADLIVLDLMLASENGLSLAREIRSVSDVPIIILSGKGDLIDKIIGLEVGADDYITKPFHPRELTARVRSLLRRSNSEKAHSAGIPIRNAGKQAQFGSWKYSFDNARLESESGEGGALTTLESRFLEVFLDHPKRNLSRDQIMNFAADRDWNPLDRSVDVIIGKLRKKLRDDVKEPRYIRTSRGTGYSFIADIRWS